jgi:hypothetical protein
MIRPRFLQAGRAYDWIDLLTGKSQAFAASDAAALRRTLRPHEALALTIRAR